MLRTRVLMGLALIGFVMMPGCTRFVYKTAYNTADFLVMRELDRYFQLRDDQRAFLDSKIDRLHAWHRHQELPRYAAALRGFRERFARGLKPADIDWLFARSNEFRDTAFRRVCDDAVVFLNTLRPEQVRHLQAAFEESNAEIAEQLQAPRNERVAERRDDTLEFLRDWTGGLRPEQQTMIAGRLEKLPELDRSRLRFRRERQAEFLAKLPANGGDPEKLESVLRVWLHRPDESRPAYYRQEVSRWRAEFRDVALAIDASMDAAQRRAVLQRLNHLIADLEELSR